MGLHARRWRLPRPLPHIVRAPAGVAGVGPAVVADAHTAPLGIPGKVQVDRGVQSAAMRARTVIRVAVGVTALLVVAFLTAWVWFREETKSWAWWHPPAVLTIGGRHFHRDGHMSTTIAEAKSQGGGTWKKVQIEWPIAMARDSGSHAQCLASGKQGVPPSM